MYPINSHLTKLKLANSTVTIAFIALLLLSGCDSSPKTPKKELTKLEAVEENLKSMKVKKRPPKKQALETGPPEIERIGAQAQKSESKFRWPPALGQSYPDLPLVDLNGKPVQLSKFKGKVILLELVAMSCAACNAFSGANRLTPFPGAKVQKGLLSIEEYFTEHTGGLRLRKSQVVFIQLVLYNMRNQPPSQADMKAWAKHFKLTGVSNFHVLAGPKELLTPATWSMIPGFHLIDKNFILISDSTGHKPKHDLFRTLLPMIKKVM